MKKFILITSIFLSFNFLIKGYEGGYIDGKWYAFYNNTYRERGCIQDKFDEGPAGCSEFGTNISINKVDLMVIGIAEIKDKVLLKVSDFKLNINNRFFEKDMTYTPNNYPVRPNYKGNQKFPIFYFSNKEALLSYLKENNKNMTFNGKEWIEDYNGKKIKFLGVDSINLKWEPKYPPYYTNEKGDKIELN